MLSSASQSAAAPRHQPDCETVEPVLRSLLHGSKPSAEHRRRAQDLAWQWLGNKWPRLLNAVSDRSAKEVHVAVPGAELLVASHGNGQSWSLAVAHRERDGGRTWLTRAQVAAGQGVEGTDGKGSDACEHRNHREDREHHESREQHANDRCDVFSVQTSCTALAQRPRVLAPPGVLQLWVDRLALEDGGFSVLGQTHEVFELGQLEAFFGHVQAPLRRLPIVALCHQPRSQYYGVDPQALAIAVRGMAHVVCFSTETCAVVAQQWGLHLAPVAGAARLYMPGFTAGLAAALPAARLAPLWRDPRAPGTPRNAEPGAYRRLLCQKLCEGSVTAAPLDRELQADADRSRSTALNGA